jgi:hypothetical protein
MEATASSLIAEGAEAEKISRAKADYQAADIDLSHLRRALDTAKLELDAAKEEQAVDVIKQNGDKISLTHLSRFMEAQIGYWKL